MQPRQDLEELNKYEDRAKKDGGKTDQRHRCGENYTSIKRSAGWLHLAVLSNIAFQFKNTSDFWSITKSMGRGGMGRGWGGVRGHFLVHAGNQAVREDWSHHLSAFSLI